MYKKKIFIEVGIPEQIRRRLLEKTEKWKDFPVKWTKKENLHITVSFIGYVDESVVPDICQKVRDAAGKIEPFEIFFGKIALGPDDNNPKMIWAAGEPNAELGNLNEKIEEALGMRPEKHKEYLPHITLGRIRKLKWDSLEEKPRIDEKTNFSMTVESVSVMGSRGGEEEYSVLEECPLL